MRYFLTFFVGFIFLSGCSIKQEADKKIVYVYKRFTMNGWWKLEILNGNNINKPIKLFLNEKDKRFYGNDGCNNILGTLTKTSKSELLFGAVASTMMACEDMKTPLEYVKTLERVKSYKVLDPYIYMYDEDKKEILKFRKSKKGP